ncbi:MAG: hypothetical protein V3S16_08780 [Candidatus Desulfatibia sp.]|uniref:hypothetical protein n=1 Tax=Candidatus Desulfatibia sp. TaxID=3101189 RepID=UPI002F2CC832
MEYVDKMPRKEVAWNGIKFQAPVSWEVAKIGTCYLLLEEESQPVLEVKWGRVRGTFSHKTHLRRLTALHGKLPGKTVRECSLPSGWQKALESFEVAGFSWHGKSLGGLGVILYCPLCKNATLLQFYYRDSGKSKNIYLSVLESFQDHGQDDQTVWSIFDIRAVVPDKLKMIRYRLEPGQFELVFKSKHKKVTLFRWSPAAILLRNRDLVEFSKNMASSLRDNPQFVIEADGKAVEWEVSPSISGWLRLFNRMQGKHPFKRLRVWHLEEKNRILGVKAEGKEPLDAPFFDRICDTYEIL